MKTSPSMHIQIIIHVITLTNYYKGKNAFISKIITAQLMWKQKTIE